jgi:hypothetical protein
MSRVFISIPLAVRVEEEGVLYELDTSVAGFVPKGVPS